MVVSVIIPTYNSAKYIKSAINSILSQTYKDFEIIVVDDGSTDSTKEVLKNYIKTNKIKYIYQKKKNQASARNKGVGYSKGEFIAFLDSDDLWLKDKLAKQLPLFNDKTIGLVYGGVEWFKNHHTIKNRKNIIKRKIPKDKGYLFNKLIVHNFITTSSVIIRKKAFQKFNENDIYGGVEDYDLWLKISKKWKIDCVKDIVIKYRMHEKNVSINLESRYDKELKVKKQFFEQLNKQSNKNSAKKLINKSLWDTNFNTAYGYNQIGDYSRSNHYLKKATLYSCFKINNYKLLIKNLFKI